jgi:hypothetical protein
MSITVASHMDVSSSGALKNHGGIIVSVLLTAGSDAATLILHDNVSTASGVKLATIKAAPDSSFAWYPVMPYRYLDGIYATISGTSAAATVVYMET